MQTIILAGGYATRLLPLTKDRPKSLLPIAGRPIIEHILAAGQLPTPITLSTNQCFAVQFETWRQTTGTDIDILVEESTCNQEKLGAIGALAHVIQQRTLDEDVLVIAGDNLFGFSVDEFLAAYDGSLLVALHDIGSVGRIRNRYGVAIVASDTVTGFQEKPDCPSSTLASTACYVYPRALLPTFAQYLRQATAAGQDSPGYLNQWLLEERGVTIKPFVFETAWFDIGDRASYIAAHKSVTGSANWIARSATVEDSRISECVILDNARLTNCSLTGCVVAEGAKLERVTLRNALIAAGTDVRITQ